MSTKDRAKDYLESPSEFHRTIPYPKGPFTTGCMDLMVGRDENGTLMRIFYPTDAPEYKKTSPCSWAKWHLGENYCQGMAYYVTAYINFSFLTAIVEFISRKFLNFIFCTVKVPCLWHEPVAKEGHFPVMVFSHGYCTNRSMYSSICNDVASHGIIIAAVEHRDGSANGSFTLTDNGKQIWLKHKTMNLNKDESMEKQEMLKCRTNECSRTLNVLLKLNNGIATENQLIGNSYDLKQFKSKMDFTKTFIAGHSFGGATVLETLALDQRFRAGIALDTWMLPLVHKAEEVRNKIKQPILMILMERFQIPKNMAFIEMFENKKNKIFTIHNAVHLHQMDLPLVLSKEKSVFQKVSDCYSESFQSKVPMSISNALMLKYIFDEIEDKKQGDMYDEFLKLNREHYVEAIRGTAKRMVGWKVCHKTPPPETS